MGLGRSTVRSMSHNADRGDVADFPLVVEHSCASKCIDRPPQSTGCAEDSGGAIPSIFEDCGTISPDSLVGPRSRGNAIVLGESCRYDVCRRI